MIASPNQSKKLIYGLIIVVLFGAMFPYAYWLNEEKKKRDLGEAAIGQVDAGGFMMKLFLLGGFRGIVANYLWLRAEENKRDHDWDRLKATVDLITKLQPHFLAIWTFQGWNLAYNVSVEWDAPDDKYEWIKKGIQFVQEGVDKNKRSPDLQWDTAWFYYHKLGFSDESVILRRLFRDDPEEGFKTYYDPEAGHDVVRHDNFQLGYGWFTRAVNLVDSGATRVATALEADINYVDPSPQRKGRPGDLAFRSMPAHAQTRYASGLEKMSILGVPATFGEVAKNEWARALREWVKFASYKFDSPNQVPRDGKLETDVIVIDDATVPERYETLNDNQKYWADRWAGQMNYRYWKERSMVEMTTEGVLARQAFYEGTVAYKTADFAKAAQRFRDGLDLWSEALKDFPFFRDDEFNNKDTGLVVARYIRVLEQAGEPVPDDFPFKKLLASAEADPTVDPFDAMEMISMDHESMRSIANQGGGSTSTSSPGQPAPSSR
jgi:hypothetical protein